MSSPLRRELRPTLALAMPIVVAQVGQMLIGLTDTAMIGRIGTLPLAAASFTNGAFTVFFLAGLGLLLPVGVFTARDFGAGQLRDCTAWLRHGRALAWAVGAGSFAALAIVSTQLDHFGQPPAVVAIMQPFFLLISASLIPTLLFQVQRQFAESLGHPRIPMLVMLADVALNVVLNWLLIWGHAGFPALGLPGAGLATLIARTAAVVALAIYLHRARSLDFVRSREPWVWERSRVRAIFGMGVPASASLLFEAGLFATAAVFMGWLSTTALAAHQIALVCAGFTFMFPLGVATAVSMRVSKSVGAGQRDAARAIGLGGMLISAVVMSAFALIFAVAGEALAAGFSIDRDVVKLAGRLLAIAAIFQLFDGGQVVAVGALRGLGDVRIPTAISFVTYWIIALPAGYALAFHTSLGPIGVWIGLAIGLGFAAIVLGWRYHRLTKVPAGRG